MLGEAAWCVQETYRGKGVSGEGTPSNECLDGVNDAAACARHHIHCAHTVRLGGANAMCGAKGLACESSQLLVEHRNCSEIRSRPHLTRPSRSLYFHGCGSCALNSDPRCGPRRRAHSADHETVNSGPHRMLLSTCWLFHLSVFENPPLLYPYTCQLPLTWACASAAAVTGRIPCAVRGVLSVTVAGVGASLSPSLSVRYTIALRQDTVCD